MYLLGMVIIILDGLIIYYSKGNFNDLNYFYPMLTLTFLISIYEDNVNYFKRSFFIGLIYDLFYSSILFYNSLIFLFLSKINRKIFHLIKPNLFNRVIILIINIILYDLTNFMVIYLVHYNSVSFDDLFYKISHSLLLNILSLFVLHFLLKIPKIKHKL